MLKILITSASVEGRSTLAAVVTQSLREKGIPVRLVDHPVEAGDAEQLLTDEERFRRNVLSIGTRDTMMKREVLVETRLVSRDGTVNIPGDFDKHIALCCLATKTGNYTGAVEHMHNAFKTYGGPVRAVVWETLQLGHLNSTERVALTSLYEYMRLTLRSDEYEALPKG